MSGTALVGRSLTLLVVRRSRAASSTSSTGSIGVVLIVRVMAGVIMNISVRMVSQARRTLATAVQGQVAGQQVDELTAATLPAPLVTARAALVRLVPATCDVTLGIPHGVTVTCTYVTDRATWRQTSKNIKTLSQSPCTALTNDMQFAYRESCARGQSVAYDIPTSHVSQHWIDFDWGYPTLCLDLPITKGWCQPNAGHVSYSHWQS